MKTYQGCLVLLVLAVWWQPADAAIGKAIGEREIDDKRRLLHVLAIGISDYAASSISDLPGSVADVQAVATVLKKGAAALYGAVEVGELTDQQASKAAILQAVNRAAARLRAEDIFVFYFSGHTLSGHALSRYELSEGETWLAPQDAAPSGQGAQSLATLLSATELQAALDGVQANRRLLIFDGSMYVDVDTGVQGTHLIQATGPGGAAYSGVGLSRFTAVLQQGLQGWADADQDGRVSVFELAGYVGRHLPALGSDGSNRQFPGIRLYGPDFPLVGKSDEDSRPAAVSLADKLDATLVGLIRAYEADGMEGVRAYVAERQLDIPNAQVEVIINAISADNLGALKEQVVGLGGSVQTEFENILYATLPVGTLEDFVMQEAVWRMDWGGQVLFGPPTVPPSR